MNKPRHSCTCGSRKFKAEVSIQLHGMPVWFDKKGGLRYNDVKADSSEGWDTAEQPEVACAKCGHLWRVASEFGKKGKPGTFHLAEV